MFKNGFFPTKIHPFKYEVIGTNNADSPVSTHWHPAEQRHNAVINTLVWHYESESDCEWKANTRWESTLEVNHSNDPSRINSSCFKMEISNYLHFRSYEQHNWLNWSIELKTAGENGWFYQILIINPEGKLKIHQQRWSFSISHYATWIWKI